MSGLRVVQWATGNVGSRSLRHIIDHPDLTLAGLYVTSPGKVGKDAGELAGRPDTGVKATNDPDEIIGLGADAVLYMPAVCDLDQVCAILAAGSNIVSTCGEFYHPASLPPADRERVEEACAKGGTSIHSTGSSPGFITEAIPLVLASIQRRVDGITIREFAATGTRNSPEMLFDLMGFGKQPEDFPMAFFSFGAHSFGPSLRLLAEAIGKPLDSVTGSGEIAVTPKEHTIAAGTLAAGTVAGLRMTVTGLHAGQPLVTFIATWYVADDLDQDWDLRGNGWNVTIDGDAPLDVDIRFAIPEGQEGEMTPGYTANRAVNAVPYVVAAAPGMRSTVDLPQIIPFLGSR